LAPILVATDPFVRNDGAINLKQYLVEISEEGNIFDLGSTISTMLKTL
jgi:hypothetical protein